jgi:hypothetical protein
VHVSETLGLQTPQTGPNASTEVYETVSTCRARSGGSDRSRWTQGRYDTIMFDDAYVCRLTVMGNRRVTKDLLRIHKSGEATEGAVKVS